MDTLSHALWGRGLFGFRGHSWLALWFGAMPDLLSFGPFFLWRLLHGELFHGRPPLEAIPDWTFFAYNLMHSLLVAGLAVGLVACIRRDIAWAMLAWVFHILLDIPTHSASYFATRMFWPVSDFYIDGIPWTRPEIWYSNLAGLLLLFLWRAYTCGLWKRRKD
ncbi:MAG: hypothetical protein PHC35_02655 [Deltaproteobacteria bacterium]|nr:hypothetical protein [Deltaproteobacteria bacterium]